MSIWVSDTIIANGSERIVYSHSRDDSSQDYLRLGPEFSSVDGSCGYATKYR